MNPYRFRFIPKRIMSTRSKRFKIIQHDYIKNVLILLFRDDNTISTATFHGCADEIEALSDSPDCANGEISVKDIFF